MGFHRDSLDPVEHVSYPSRLIVSTTESVALSGVTWAQARAT
jgi:hypothetical protein